MCNQQTLTSRFHRLSQNRLRCSLHVLVLVAVTTAPVWGQMTLLVDRTDDVGFVSACQDAVPDDCTLRGAINLANAIPLATEVLIVLEAGHYRLTIAGPGDNFNATGDLDVLRDMTLQGQGSDATTIAASVAAGFDDRLLEVHGSGLSVSFDSLAFALAAPPSEAPAVLVTSDNIVHFGNCGFRSNGTDLTLSGGLELEPNVEATISNCAFSSNVGGDGGAITSRALSLEITDSTFEENVAFGSGGALYLQSPGGMVTGTTSILRSTFRRNAGESGGAIHAAGHTVLDVTDSTVSENIASSLGLASGGGIYSQGSLEVQGSTFSENSSEASGAAIFSIFNVLPAASVDVFNSTFSSHTGAAGVAAVHLDEVSAEFLHATFANNQLDLSSNVGNLTLGNNLLTAGCSITPAVFTSNGGNVVLDDSCWGISPHPSDLEIVDFELLPLGSYDGPTRTHLPLAGSLVIGAAPLCVPTDQRGLPRNAVNCTSGAVERQAIESLLFADGFESGGVLQWSGSQP